MAVLAGTEALLTLGRATSLDRMLMVLSLVASCRRFAENKSSIPRSDSVATHLLKLRSNVARIESMIHENNDNLALYDLPLHNIITRTLKHSYAQIKTNCL